MSTYLNGSKNCYVSPTIQLNICHLLTHKLNDQIDQFLTIQFNISNLFVYGLNAKQFYLILDRTLSSGTAPGHNGHGSDGNDGVLRIPKVPALL